MTAEAPGELVLTACPAGVKRSHLLDARLDGGLLLELYTRDGVVTMISADFYEGVLVDPERGAGAYQPRGS